MTAVGGVPAAAPGDRRADGGDKAGAAAEGEDEAVA